MSLEWGEGLRKRKGGRGEGWKEGRAWRDLVRDEGGRGEGEEWRVDELEYLVWVLCAGGLSRNSCFSPSSSRPILLLLPLVQDHDEDFWH